MTPDIDLAWLRARTRREHGHWLWTGKGKNQGLPQFRFTLADGSTPLWNVRRLVFIRSRELDPCAIMGMPVVCACGEGDCLHPNHLECITRSELARRSDKSGNRNPARCMKIAIAKREELSQLTQEMVAQIRCSDLSLTQLAAIYPGSRAAMGRIKRGESWKDYDNPMSASRWLVGQS